MAKDCEILMPEDFLYSVLSKPDLRDKYSQLSFLEYVKVCTICRPINPLPHNNAF